MYDAEVQIQNKIGVRIKGLRLKQNRTMQELADSCNLSKSMISKIESNKAIPSVAALVKIASSLGVSVSDLLEKEDVLTAEFTTSRHVEENITYTEKGYGIFPYAPNVHHKRMQPFLFKARRGEVVKHLVNHEGEEFIYVLQGSMYFKVGDVRYELKAGDGLYFNSLEPHGMMPISEEVVYIDIFV
jgi:transcriptional regulator with XRE-family HTH domain